MSEMNPQSAEPGKNPIRHRNKIATSKEMNTADTPKSKICFPSPIGTPMPPSASTRDQPPCPAGAAKRVGGPPQRLRRNPPSKIQNPTFNITAFATASRRSREARRRTYHLSPFHFSLSRFQVSRFSYPPFPLLQFLRQPPVQDSLK